jgi:hypothetical protein
LRGKPTPFPAGRWLSSGDAFMSLGANPDISSD